MRTHLEKWHDQKLAAALRSRAGANPRRSPMHTELIQVDRGEAAKLFRKYREHAAYSAPIDWEIQRAYQLIAQGKMIIRALESIKQAGLNREFLPRLAIAPATAKTCFMWRTRDGSVVYRDTRYGERK